MTETEQDLTEQYLPLVKAAVDRFRLHLPSHVDWDDLHSVGITGLLSAVRRHSPERAATFGAYAATRIRGAILDELRRMDLMSRRSRATFKKLQRVRDQLTQERGTAPTDQEMCKEMGIHYSVYLRLVAIAGPITQVSLDSTPTEDGRPLHESIPDEQDSPGRDQMEENDDARLVATLINQLPEKKKRMLAMRYFDGLTLEEIAPAFGITASRTQQILYHTVNDLRQKVAINRAK